MQPVNSIFINICRWFIKDINIRIYGINRSESKYLFFATRKAKNTSTQQIFNLKTVSYFLNTGIYFVWLYS